MPKLIEIKEALDLCDIWRIRNPKSNFFTLHQNHISGRIQRRLDYFLISNILQETVIRADDLASFCNDHSPTIFTISFELNNKRGKGLRKFNKILLPNDEYINKLKNNISDSLSILDQNGIKNYQIRWEFRKFEIRQFSVTFSQNFSKSLNAEREILQKEPKYIEKSSSSYFDNEDYVACKTKLDKTYNKKVKGLRIRSKCDWYK